MSNAAPGFAKYPNHTVDISPAAATVAVAVDGMEIARTDQALALAEADYPPVYYVPLESLPAQILQASEHTTYCPFKGEAKYFHLVHNGETHENAVWTYPAPYDEAMAISGHVAIYPNAATIAPVE